MRAMFSLEKRVCWNGKSKPAWRTSLPVPLPLPHPLPLDAFPSDVSYVSYLVTGVGNVEPNLGFWVLFLFYLISCLRGLGLTFTVLHRYTLVCVCGFLLVDSTSACTDRRSPRGIRCDTGMGLFAVSYANLFVMYCLHVARLR